MLVKIFLPTSCNSRSHCTHLKSTLCEEIFNMLKEAEEMAKQGKPLAGEVCPHSMTPPQVGVGCMGY